MYTHNNLKRNILYYLLQEHITQFSFNNIKFFFLKSFSLHLRAYMLNFQNHIFFIEQYFTMLKHFKL